MRAKLALLGSRELPVDLLRDCELGLAAGEAAFELLPDGAAGTEDQRLDGGDRDLEDLGDLGVAPALELAHDERRPLVEREVAERPLDVLDADRVVADEGLGDVLVQLDLARAARGLAEALTADVVRDRDQPVLRRLRPVAVREGAVRVQERRLRDVLGIGRIAENCERVAIDVACMAPVEALEVAVDSGPLCE